jgi:hypothetical protein
VRIFFSAAVIFSRGRLLPLSLVTRILGRPEVRLMTAQHNDAHHLWYHAAVCGKQTVHVAEYML